MMARSLPNPAPTYIESKRDCRRYGASETSGANLKDTSRGNWYNLRARFENKARAVAKNKDPHLQPPSNRNAAFDLTRGALVLLVVAHHTILTLSSMQSVPHWLIYANWCIGAVRMPLLMLTSGYFASSLLVRDISATRSRALNLAWLFIVWLPVYWMARRMIGMPVNATWITQEILAPTSPMWFLWGLALMVASLIILRGASRLYILLLAAEILCVANRGIFQVDIISYRSMFHYGGFFYFGVYCRPEIERVIRAGPAKMMIASGLLLFASLILENALLRSVALCGCTFCGALVLTTVPAGFKWLERFGRDTLPVYIAHGPWLLLLRQLVVHGGQTMVLLELPLLLIAMVLLSRFTVIVANHVGMAWLYQRPDLGAVVRLIRGKARQESEPARTAR